MIIKNLVTNVFLRKGFRIYVCKKILMKQLSQNVSQEIKLEIVTESFTALPL